MTDPIKPDMDPIHDLLGLTLGNIFFLPKNDPNKNAAESQVQIDITNVKVILVFIRVSNCLRSTEVPSNNGIIMIPVIVDKILIMGSSLLENSSQMRVMIITKRIQPNI